MLPLGVESGVQRLLTPRPRQVEKIKRRDANDTSPSCENCNLNLCQSLVTTVTQPASPCCYNCAARRKARIALHFPTSVDWQSLELLGWEWEGGRGMMGVQPTLLPCLGGNFRFKQAKMEATFLKSQISAIQ
jgi:hypothetical protein